MSHAISRRGFLKGAAVLAVAAAATGVLAGCGAGNVVKINYYSEAEGKQIYEGSLRVPVGTVSVNTSELKDIPEGYVPVTVGDLLIADGYVYVNVCKGDVVKVNYYCESQNKQIAEVELTVFPGASSVQVSALKAPKGYKLTTTATQLAINGGYVYAAVEPESES